MPVRSRTQGRVVAVGPVLVDVERAGVRRLGDEGEQAARSPGRLGRRDQVGDPHGRLAAGQRDELDLTEPAVTEPGSYPPGQIRRPARPRPDDAGVGCAQSRQHGDGVLDVGVGDVAQHTAEQDEVGRRQVRIHVVVPGVGGAHLDTGPAAGSVAGVPGEAGVELDEGRRDAVGVVAPGEDLEQVAAVPRAETDHPDRSRRRGVQPYGDLVLDDAQPATQGGGRVGVGAVPGLPVGHRSSLGGVLLRSGHGQ